MTGVSIVIGSLVAVMALSEFVLGETKLQTGLARVLAAWAAVYLAVVYAVFRYGGVGPVGFTLFWGGAFLSWFGVRSHIESSILLRMLHMLRHQAMDESAVITKYTSSCGQSTRLDELLRGNMATRSGDQLVVTPKGKTILGVVAKLR